MKPSFRLFIAAFCCFAVIAVRAADVEPANDKCPESVVDVAADWKPDPKSGLSLWGGDDRQGYAFLFLGTFHSFDPNAAHVPEIQRFFARFRPTWVLYEGGAMATVRTRDEAIRSAGEMGLAQWLAQICGVPSATFEPDFAGEVALVIRQFSPEQAKLYYVARLIPQLAAQGQMNALDERLSLVLREKRWMAAGLADARPRNIAELAEGLRAALPQIEDWRKVEYAHVAPISRFNTTERGLLNQLATATSAIRDDALVSRIREGLRRGERVLVIGGTTHMLGVREKLDLAEFRQR